MIGIPELKIKYTSPAYPPKYIDMHKVYKFGTDQNGCYVTDGNFFKYMPFGLIRAYFSPVEKIYNWNEIQKMFDEQLAIKSSVKKTKRRKKKV